NAALFHVPSQELPRVLLELKASLKPGGALFSSNPRGHNEEGWSQGRYGVYHDLEAWRRYMSLAGFVELSHYYRPAGVPRERQPWLASVWRRLASESSWDQRATRWGERGKRTGGGNAVHDSSRFRCPMKLDKTEITRRQLGTALALFLEDSDRVARRQRTA